MLVILVFLWNWKGCVCCLSGSFCFLVYYGGILFYLGGGERIFRDSVCIRGFYSFYLIFSIGIFDYFYFSLKLFFVLVEDFKLVFLG